MTHRAPHAVELSDLLDHRLPGGVRVTDVLVRAEGDTWNVCAAVADGALHDAYWDRGELALGGLTAGTGLTSLRRDVLDRQVVDAAGRRVVRVGDVALHPVDGRLEAVALEVGVRPVLRRLGLRRLARRHREELLRPRDVTITPSCVVAHSSREHLADIETHHLARLIRRLPHRMKHDVLGQLPEDRRRDVREHMEHRPHRPRWHRYRTPHA